MERLDSIIANPYIPRVSLWVFMIVATFAQTVDLSRQTEETPGPLKVGTIVPGTCTVGERFYRTDEQPGLYRCTAPNKWEFTYTESPLGGGSGIWLRDEWSGGSAPEIGEYQKRSSNTKHPLANGGGYPKDPSGKWEIRQCSSEPDTDCLRLFTRFVLAPQLVEALDKTEGVESVLAFGSRYSAIIYRGELFTNEEVADRVADVVRAHLGKEKSK